MRTPQTIRAISGTNHEGTSAHNRRVVMDALRLNGALSRADLARATRLTKQTVSNIMEDLEKSGLVVAEASVRRGRGQPSRPYHLVPEGAFAIGLQIDRHLVRGAVVDLVGNMLQKSEAALPDGGPATGVRVILELIEELRRKLSAQFLQAEKRLVGLGVAMPGPFGDVGSTDEQHDNPWMMAPWQRFPLLETLAAGTGLDVSRQNDASAFTTAERMIGAAHGLEHAVCLYVGYGVGAGLILDGALYGGAHGNAGEVGMAFIGSGPERTPLEHRASLASLCAHLGIDPMAPDIHAILADRAASNDPAIDSWLEKAAVDLRWSVHMIETVFDPQTVILCGSAPEALARRLIAAVEPLLPSNAMQSDRVLPRLQLGITDPWAVVLGAAAEPIGTAFDPRFAAIFKE